MARGRLGVARSVDEFEALFDYLHTVRDAVYPHSQGRSNLGVSRLVAAQGDHGGVRLRLPVAEFPDLPSQSREFSPHCFHVLKQKFICDGPGHVSNMRLSRRVVKRSQALAAVKTISSSPYVPLALYRSRPLIAPLFWKRSFQEQVGAGSVKT